MSVIIKKIKSPCIGVCSTGIGDSVCRGCKRYAHEVIDWNSYTNEQREIIYTRINSFLSQVVAAKIAIVDASKLAAFLDAQKVPVPENGDDYAKVFALLKAGAQQLDTLALVGCEVGADFAHLNLVELRDLIDKDFYTLSSAHYERYFPH